VAFFRAEKTRVRTEHKIATLNKPSDKDAPITVDDMLAAAEGRTADTKDKSNPEIAMARAAKIGNVERGRRAGRGHGRRTAASGRGDPDFGLEETRRAAVRAARLCGHGARGGHRHGVVSAYPFVRFRAALGFGFVGFIFYTQGVHVPTIETAVACAGLYFCTILTEILLVTVSALAAIVGFGAVTYYLLSI